VAWQAHYDPFGRATVVTQTVVNNLRLPGQYYDQETGLHYNYFRDYDPTIGRYVQSDPIGLRGGLNTYAYVNGNPMKFTDSLGLLDPLGEGRPSQGIGGFIDRLYNEILGDDAIPSDKANDPADAIAGAPVPPFSIPSEGGKRISIDPTKCPPGHQLIEPSTKSAMDWWAKC
jgi:RHS repeat-associated protein